MNSSTLPQFHPVPPIDLAADSHRPLRASAQLLMYSIAILGILITLVGDWITGGVVFLGGMFGWRGFKSGVIRVLCGWMGIGAVLIGAVSVGKYFVGPLRSLEIMPLVPARYFSILVTAVAFLVGGQILGYLLAFANRCLPNPWRYAPVIGMVLGIAEGGLFAIMLFIAFLGIEPPARMGLAMFYHQPTAKFVYDQLIWLAEGKDQSSIGRRLAAVYADEHDVLEVGAMLAVASRYPEAVRSLDHSPLIGELLNRESVLRRVKDEIKIDVDLHAAVKEANWKKILNSKTLLHILTDSELAEVIRKYHRFLMINIIRSIPPEFYHQAYPELARIRGVTLDKLQILADEEPIFPVVFDHTQPSSLETSPN